ncbi:hypothetical protein NC651_001547 [Populus alba x Populus x berolinensis]|nr:hypothetical protein NC651_001547 [Populus alba x Populus x berolinensis]
MDASLFIQLANTLKQAKITTNGRKMLLCLGKRNAEECISKDNYLKLKQKLKKNPGDDLELNKRLKKRSDILDMMQKKCSEPVLADLVDSEKMTESRFIIPQDIPSPNWIKRGFDAVPNRSIWYKTMKTLGWG